MPIFLNRRKWPPIRTNHFPSHGTRLYGVSGAGELPPCALSEPDVNLSAHPAPIIQPWVLHQTANAEIIRAAFWLSSLTNIPPF